MALGVAFFAVAVLFAVFVLLDQPLASWVLLAVAVVLAGVGLICLQTDGLRKWLSILILNRTLPFVRGIYVIELPVAIAMIWIAVAHR